MRKILSGVLTVIILAAAVISFGSYRTSVQTRLYTRREFVMGTLLSLQAYGPNAETAFSDTVRRMHEITDRMTINDAGSETLLLKQHAAIAPVELSADTFFVLSRALDYAESTNGAFDPTIEPLVSLWRIGFPDARVPEPNEIDSKLPLVDYSRVQLNEAESTAYLPVAGMGVDLGAIAKGFAADESRRIMEEHGVKSALISVGGNIYAMGEKPDNTPWRIGIQDPLDSRNRVMATLDVKDETLVTSGGYERYLDAGGVRYHHILDPSTGYPAETDLLSVTIVSKSSIDADALSTSLFLMGRDAALEYAQRDGGFEAVLIDDDLGVYCTCGIQNRLTIVNSNYTLVSGNV